jgi:hypothetical protein
MKEKQKGECKMKRSKKIVSGTGKRRTLIIVGIIFGLPLLIVLLPLSPLLLIWYMNASGLYQVMRATRQRQRRLVGILRRAEGTS